MSQVSRQTRRFARFKAVAFKTESRASQKAHKHTRGTEKASSSQAVHFSLATTPRCQRQKERGNGV